MDEFIYQININNKTLKKMEKIRKKKPIKKCLNFTKVYNKYIVKSKN